MINYVVSYEETTTIIDYPGLLVCEFSSILPLQYFFIRFLGIPISVLGPTQSTNKNLLSLDYENKQT